MTKSKTALVTGANRGLGRDMAINLAKKGLNVVLTYNTNKGEADSVVEEIKLLGQKAVAFQLNVSEPETFDNFIGKVTTYLRENEGSPNFDFLINNAGFVHQSSLETTTAQQLDDMYNVHFRAPFFLTQKVLPFLNENGGIVNISSGLARFATPGYGAYGSMKKAIEQFTVYLAKELGNRKIRANVVAPGPIETDFQGGAVRDNPELNKILASHSALGRVGMPDDIGGVVAFLCTDGAKWVNAQRIEVSGGINI